MSPNPARWAPERLAYWYFRLNGFLTTENFVVHPDTGQNQRTDADLLAVRFAHRAENLVRPMTDDSKVVSCRTYANMIIAEVKTGACALNGPWTDPTSGNLKRVLKGVGCVAHDAVDQACKALYDQGRYSDSTVTIRLFAIGESRAELPIHVNQQITWDDVIAFCVERFRRYAREKSSVGQWPEDGLQLKKLATGPGAQAGIRSSFGLRGRGAPQGSGA